MIGLGYDPKWSRSKQNWMPKGRYEIMKNFMPKVGQLGLDMMLRTCTIQVNLDYLNEQDMVQKFQTSLALQSIATAILLIPHLLKVKKVDIYLQEQWSGQILTLIEQVYQKLFLIIFWL